MRQGHRALLRAWQGCQPVIGMVHLLALPGAPGFGGELREVHAAAMRDAETLVAGGVSGLMLENFFDTPFFPTSVPAVTVAHMTAIAREIRQRFQVPLGINVLRNDGCSSLAVAHAAGAEFIRVNILTGARLTDQGVIQGIAHDLLRLRHDLAATDIRILADVNVKHSAPLADYDPVQEVEDAVRRGGADAVIVSGPGTGKGVAADELVSVRAAASGVPVFVGSGITPDSLAALAGAADGFIVGTGFKVDGRVELPVDPVRVAALLEALQTHQTQRE